MLVTSFYNMADTFFVGMLKNDSVTGAVGVVFSVMAVIQAVGFFFGHGSGNFISRELGKQNFEEASNMAATGFFSALAAGLLICVLGQLFLIFCKDNILITDKSSSSRNEFTDDDVLLKTFQLVCFTSYCSFCQCLDSMSEGSTGNK